MAEVSIAVVLVPVRHTRVKARLVGLVGQHLERRLSNSSSTGRLEMLKAV